MDILEKDLEKKMKDRLEKLGCMVLKFTSPGNAGVPDRLVFIPGGKLVLVELKRPGGKLRPLQKVWAKKFGKLGFKHRTVKNENNINELMELVRKEVMKNEVHTVCVSDRSY